MSGLKTVALSEIAAPVKYAINGGPFGSKLTSKRYTSQGVPVIRGCNLAGPGKFSFEDFVYVSLETADELRANLARPGDLVFTQRGTLGQVGLIPEDSPFNRFVISQSQMKLTVDQSKADPHFLYYYFTDERTVARILGQAFSAGVPHINLAILREFEVSLPPLPEQRRIAGILGAYDDLIENCQRRIKILEEMARSLYCEWFVHFRNPGHESVPLVDSHLGPIPQGWEVKTLGEVLELVYGKALKAEERRGGSVAVYGSSGVIGWHDEAQETGPGIIVGRKGNVGSIFWSPTDYFVIDTAYYVKSRLPLRFVYHALQGKNFINNDSAVPGLSRQQAYALHFVVPCREPVQHFCNQVNVLSDEAQQLRMLVGSLARQHRLILSHMFDQEH